VKGTLAGGRREGEEGGGRRGVGEPGGGSSLGPQRMPKRLPGATGHK